MHVFFAYETIYCYHIQLLIIIIENNAQTIRAVRAHFTRQRQYL